MLTRPMVISRYIRGTEGAAKAAVPRRGLHPIRDPTDSNLHGEGIAWIGEGYCVDQWCNI